MINAELQHNLYLLETTVKIFYYDELIANDLNDFFEKYLEDERYFLN